MKIAVDAMGGDHAPRALVEGAILAKPQCPADLVLIGDEERLREILAHLGEASSIEVVHSPETIGMGEAGPMAIRRKRDASMSMAMRFLAAGEVDAVVSAGNSSAIVATARHFVGLMPGLRRPAMAVPIPVPSGRILLLDAGAHAEASTVHLAQSAALAHVYLRVIDGLENPRVGLLNLGQEPIKGTKIVQRAFSLLQRSSLNFAGNIEPHELFEGRMDAAICDGFVGNVVLKMYEGLSETFIHLLDAHVDEEQADVKAALRGIFRRFQEVLHFQKVGGAPLLGVSRTVVVAHGRSEGPAIASAIQLASRLATDRVCERMAEDLERDSILPELRHQNARLMLDALKNKWGFTHKSP